MAPRSDGPAPMPATLDRRAFLRELTLASAVAASAGAVPSSLLPARESTRGDRQAGPAWHRAPCTLCGVGCGLLVAVEQGRLVAVKGDPDSPVSRGLACAKGYHAVQALYGADRLTRALVRRGGALVPVPLTEALDLVARTIRDTVTRHGAGAVGVYGAERWSMPEAYVASRLFGDGIGSPNVDGAGRLAGASASAAFTSAFGLDGSPGCLEDVDHADVLVLWGANVAETHPRLWSRMLERRRRNPSVRIIELATRTTRTSYGADRSILHAPRTELAIANALCHEIVARKWTDRDFVARHVAFKRAPVLPVSTDAAPRAEQAADASWEEWVRFLEDYSPAAAQRVSGVPQESIRWLASVYADRSLRVTTLWGTGAIRQARGSWVGNALLDVHLLLGKIATPGSGAMALAVPPWRPASRRPSRDALSIFRALERGDLRFLWVQSGDPMVELSNLRRYRRARPGTERFLVVSDAYPTPTTELADVVLPSAMWLERDGIVMNPGRRVQHFPRLVSAPGDATSEAWQMTEVARRLGLANRLGLDRPAQLERAWEEHRRAADRREMPPTLTELRTPAGALWPHAGGRDVRWRYATAHDAGAQRTQGAFDFHGHADHRAWIWLRPFEAPVEAPDRDFPFWLETGEVLEHSDAGSVTRRIPSLRRAVPSAYVELNREDADRLGVRDGERVRLASRRGALELTARIDLRSQPRRGVLFVPWFDAQHAVNLLTLDASCPVSGQPDYGCAVRIERAPSARGET